MDEQRWPHRPQELRREREVIILNPRHRSAGASLRFIGDSVREPQIHRTVPLPEFRPKLEMLNEHVAQRPERAIREAVVVAVDVGVIEPDPVQRVLRILRRNLNAPRFIADVTIRGSRPPRHPRAVGVTHRRIERRNETARRLLDLDSLRAAHVFVRLAIGDEYEFAVVQVMDKVEHGL